MHNQKKSTNISKYKTKQKTIEQKKTHPNKTAYKPPPPQKNNQPKKQQTLLLEGPHLDRCALPLS